ncbi:MAG: polymer-forming cytoskeletal protein, partial [Balneolaceae bacterium]
MKNDDLSYVSLLAKGSVINDQYLSVPSHLKISGIVTKNIECGGKLVIDSTGVVEGNVKAKDLVLHGKFEGNIWVQNTLSICRSAEITGYISADKLRVEEGAYCVMDADIDGQAKKRHDRSDIGVNSGKTRGKSGKKI